MILKRTPTSLDIRSSSTENMLEQGLHAPDGNDVLFAGASEEQSKLIGANVIATFWHA